MKAIATKIKKWVETVKELRSDKFRLSISITRLTSIKSLCQDQVAAQNFALYLSGQVLLQMEAAEIPSDYSSSEWETHKTLVSNAIVEMEQYIYSPTEEVKQSLWKFLSQIKELQGDDFRNVHWSTVHFVRSGYLLKLDYAIRCFIDRESPYYAYKLAREYTEFYDPSYGTGLIPKSAPRLLEIAEFWCQYYFGQKLSEKFPELLNGE